ncbi:MAG: flagellar transcriptional regulator FlhC [Desulfuromonas thiophila]|nr:flagellar transcriptional regulator FlhC [Desulfuromonas thiophila]MDY0251355.1 FlhC family transcriptional regulator [Pseudomonas sp.]
MAVKSKLASTMVLAEKMVAMGARPPIISSSFDAISPGMARSLWKEIHGTGSPNGLCPNNSLGRLRNNTMALHANMFFLCYARRGSHVLKTADPAEIMESYEGYIEAMNRSGFDAALDFQTAWYIARDIRSHILEVKFCRSCRVNYLFEPSMSSLSQCQLCRISSVSECGLCTAN